MFEGLKILLIQLVSLLALWSVRLGATIPEAEAPPNLSRIRVSQNPLQNKVVIQWTANSEGPVYVVTLDDAAGFRRPIFSKSVKGKQLTLDVLDAGLAPGITYFVRIDPGIGGIKFRLEAIPWSEPYLSYSYLRMAWEVSGRAWIYQYSGVKWNEGMQMWQLDREWPDQESNVGPQAYYIEYAARAAANMASVCRDLNLIDELASFFLIYANRFTTLGEMRNRGSLFLRKEWLNGQGNDSVRTLPWIEKLSVGYRIRECTLCNSQFFHPASRLIRIITTLPQTERTTTMNNFLRLYVPLIVREHLMRLLYEADVDYWREKRPAPNLVETWNAIVTQRWRPRLSHERAMLDRDLWLIATAAEILGANANDPETVPLTENEAVKLRNAVEIGIKFFQSKRTSYPETRNFQGRIVGSTSYFNGDFDDHPSYAYSGYSGNSFPTEADKKVQVGASWDLGHFYRVPVFLRSLYDNKKATRVDFPTRRDVELLTNQLTYKVFQGNFEKPLFNNFFDGSNGWMEVGKYPGFAYPPSQYCDSRLGSQWTCANNSNSLMGWGLIAFFNPDLVVLEHSLVTLAWEEGPETEAFKDRYYQYRGKYGFRDHTGRWQYPQPLFWILSGLLEKLQGIGPP